MLRDQEPRYHPHKNDRHGRRDITKSTTTANATISSGQTIDNFTIPGDYSLGSVPGHLMPAAKTCGDDRYYSLYLQDRTRPPLNRSIWEGLRKLADQVGQPAGKDFSAFLGSSEGLVLDLQTSSSTKISKLDVIKCVQAAYDEVVRSMRNPEQRFFEGGIRISGHVDKAEDATILGSIYLEDGPLPLNSVFPALTDYSSTNITAQYPPSNRPVEPSWQVLEFILRLVFEISSGQGEIMPDDGPFTVYGTVSRNKVAIDLFIDKGDLRPWSPNEQRAAVSSCLNAIVEKLRQGRYVYQSLWTCNSKYKDLFTQEVTDQPSISGSFRVVKSLLSSGSDGERLTATNVSVQDLDWNDGNVTNFAVS